MPAVAVRERGFVPTELVLLFRLAGMSVLNMWGGTAGNWGRRSLDLDVIAKAIDEADCLIAVLSEDSAASSWVHFEIGRAFGARKKVLPICVGEAPVPSDLMGVLYLQVSGPTMSQKIGHGS